MCARQLNQLEENPTKEGRPHQWKPMTVECLVLPANSNTNIQITRTTVSFTLLSYTVASFVALLGRHYVDMRAFLVHKQNGHNRNLARPYVPLCCSAPI